MSTDPCRSTGAPRALRPSVCFPQRKWGRDTHPPSLPWEPRDDASAGTSMWPSTVLVQALSQSQRSKGPYLAGCPFRQRAARARTCIVPATSRGMRLDDLPADLLLLVLGRLNAADLARAGKASGTLRAPVQRAAAHALRRLDEAAGTEVQRGVDLSHDLLQQLRACEAFFITNFSTFVHREFSGDLPPPEPSPSGCKFFECPQLGRLERAGRDVTTGGELALQSPLGSECRLEYRFVLVNDGVPCKHVPSQGVSSFLFLRKVMEVLETYVPPHLRGWRVGDRLVQQAFQMVRDSANCGRVGFRLRPTCTFVSGSFLRRHSTLPTDGWLRETDSCLDFFSTPDGQVVTARRVALKALPVAELKAMCQQRGFSTAFRKPALIEFLIQNEYGEAVFCR